MLNQERMSKNKFIDPILKEVAKEFNLPFYVVEEIYFSPFKMMREDVKVLGNWKVYLINGLGKFKPIEPILKKIARGEEINNYIKDEQEK